MLLLGAFVFRGVSRQLAGAIPALGWVVKGTMGYVGTQAIGHAAIEYFEGGGDIAGLAALVEKPLPWQRKLRKPLQAGLR